MSYFFFENKTKCEICNKPIEKRELALFTPYINGDEFPHLEKYNKAFFHRECFDNWELRDELAYAAFKLAKTIEIQDGLNDIVFSDLNFLIIYKENQSEYWINEFYSMFELRINYEQAISVQFLLNEVLQNKETQLIFDDWKFAGEKDTLFLQHSPNNRIIQKLFIPKNRIKDFIIVMDKIINYHQSKNI